MIVPNFPDGAFVDFILWPQHPLAQLCNDFTLLGFIQVGCLKFHPFLVAIHQIKGFRK
jgi:hypothetical protein